MKPYFEGLIHQPSYKPPAQEGGSPQGKKRDKTPPLLSRPAGRLGRRRPGSEGKGGFGGLGTLWRGDKREEPDYQKTRTHTLKGTRVTSSNGDNYIILSPVNPGSQVMMMMMMMMISRMF